MTIFDRIIMKRTAHIRLTGAEPKYIVVSVPVGLELINYMSEKLIDTTLILSGLDGAKVLGMTVVLLKTNRNILEVG